jgi:hypothetical protein
MLYTMQVLWLPEREQQLVVIRPRRWGVRRLGQLVVLLRWQQQQQRPEQRWAQPLEQLEQRLELPEQYELELDKQLSHPRQSGCLKCAQRTRLPYRQRARP